MKILLSITTVILIVAYAWMLWRRSIDADDVGRYSKTVERAKVVLKKGRHTDLIGSTDAWGRRWTVSENTNGVIVFMSYGVDLLRESDDIHIKYNLETHSFVIDFEHNGRMYHEALFE